MPTPCSAWRTRRATRSGQPHRSMPSPMSTAPDTNRRLSSRPRWLREPVPTWWNWSISNITTSKRNDMYLQHFGLRHTPLGKESTELWDDGAMTHFSERFAWLLQSPGIGLITGESGVGKTAALRQLTRNINPHRYQVIYQPETDFGRIDIYRGLARSLGVEP